MSIAKKRIRNFYGIDFPDDFFEFIKFLKKLPKDILGEACDLFPAFPFEVAAGREAVDYPNNPYWEDRYYHDLPEFVTLFTGTTDGLHFGYFFDAPGELPPIVAHYWHSDTFQHSIDGRDIFEACRWRVEQSVCDFREMIQDDPDEKDYYREKIDELAVIRKELANYWGANRKLTGLRYINKYDDLDRVTTAETWDDLGIVVPEGQFKPLSVNPWATQPVKLRKLQVKKLIAEARKALDEGFPGTALQLGRNLWVWADEYPECYELLDAAYGALGREPLRKLMKEARAWRAHCDQNRK